MSDRTPPRKRHQNICFLPSGDSYRYSLKHSLRIDERARHLDAHSANMTPNFIPLRGFRLGRVHYRILLECRAAVQGNCAATCQNDIHAWDTQGVRTHHRRRNSVTLPFGNLLEGPSKCTSAVQPAASCKSTHNLQNPMLVACKRALDQTVYLQEAVHGE